jgi:hypothetical protein
MLWLHAVELRQAAEVEQGVVGKGGVLRCTHYFS